LWPTAVCTSRRQSPAPRFASARSTLAGLLRGEALFISLVIREGIHAISQCLAVNLVVWYLQFIHECFLHTSKVLYCLLPITSQLPAESECSKLGG
jgi:hypothetical protein